jgi:hypothetical protein
MKKEVETITATANYSKRTFTIRRYYNGKLFAKYRTLPMTMKEFEEYDMCTEGDWKDFLKGQDYYAVKINY